MPTAREIDASASASLFRRHHAKPLVMAGAGGLLLLGCLAVAAALAPKDKPADAPKPATPPAATPANVEPAAPQKGARSILALDDGVAANVAAKNDAAVPPPDKAAIRKAAEERRAAAKTETSSTGRVYGVLAGVCLALGGIAWLVRDKLRNGRTLPGREKLLILRDQLMLDPKRRVLVIGVEGRTLVVGVVGDQMTLLSEYTPALEESATATAAAVVEAEAVEPAPPRIAREFVRAPAESAASSLAALERDVVAVRERPASARAEPTPTPARAPAPSPAPSHAPTRSSEPTPAFGRPATPFRRLEAAASASGRAPAQKDRFRALLESSAGAEAG